MLKIKNNIDLIELEIFNFYDMGNCYQKYLEFGVQLYVDKQTRIITRNAPYDARYIPNKDEISDLIKADIVEDVAEEITYAYGVNLEEDIIIIEKQQKRIAELEKDLEFTTKTANELIEIKHKLEQELAELKEMSNLIWIDLFHLNNDNNEWTKSLNKYKEEAQAKLKEIQGNE